MPLASYIKLAIYTDLPLLLALSLSPGKAYPATLSDKALDLPF